MKTPKPEVLRFASEYLHLGADSRTNPDLEKEWRAVAEWLEYLAAHVELEATVQECMKAMKKLCPNTPEAILEFHLRQALRDGQT